ncbi:MAG: TatD family hydrolase [Muribaculaceae bacterium]|nr:TatD family hydrolase [Muribaculaceae bacterium]
MTRIIDIHHHGAVPLPNAITSIMAGDPLPEGEYLFSVGIHPWQTDRNDLDQMLEAVRQAVEDPRVVAIGETGIDRLKGGNIDMQTEIFKRHIDLALETAKPLIIHNVRSSDLIIPILKKADLKAIIHGFRGKPIEAMQLLDAGAYISLGQYFNAETVKTIPDDRLFAETDESILPIDDIIKSISIARQTNPEKIKEQIALNAELLNIKKR